MSEEFEDVFDQLEGQTKEAPELAQEKLVPKTQQEEEMIEPEDEVSGDDEESEEFGPRIVPKASSQSEAEKKAKFGNREKVPSGTVLTIKSWKYTSPKTQKKNEAGKIETIPPKKAKSGKSQYYQVKLAIRFEEDNLVEYYPGATLFVNEGKISDVVKIGRKAHSNIAILFRKATVMLAKKEGKTFELMDTTFNQRPTTIVKVAQEKEFYEFQEKFSDEALLDSLIGLKVKMNLEEGNFEGNPWYRNDIKEILE